MNQYQQVEIKLMELFKISSNHHELVSLLDDLKTCALFGLLINESILLIGQARKSHMNLDLLLTVLMQVRNQIIKSFRNYILILISDYKY